MNTLLNTPRLRLQPCSSSDLEWLHALWTHEQIRHFLFDNRVISGAEAQEFINDSLTHFAQWSYGLWKVFAPAIDAEIGFAGALPSTAPSLLYGIHPDYGGQGYGTEAAQAVIAYLLEHLALPKVIADVDEPNLASIRVLEKIGMTFTHRAIVNQHPLLYFERCRF